MESVPPLSSLSFAFIGGGNMARCLIGGAIDAGVAAARVRVGEPDARQRERLTADLGVRCTADNAEAVAGADVIVIAVKPQVAAQAVRGLAGRLDGNALVVSIMAGIRAGDLRRWLGPGPALVRAMPNTPALIRMGITALYGGGDLPRLARAHASALLSTAGEVAWVDDESDLDAVTAVSGSGPAYAFLVIEALADAGTRAGLKRELAHSLAVATVRGAAEMAFRTGTEPAELRRQVTSPGGTTAAALEVLEAAGLRDAFERAVHAATARGRSLADEYGSG